LGIEEHKDGKNGNLWLSQQKSTVNTLMRFSMNIVKPVNIPLAFHCKLSSSLCPGSKEGNDYIFHLPYASTIGRMMFAMKCSRLDISHEVGVVSGHMANPEHWKWVLWYLRGTSITYGGCNDFVMFLTWLV
jgi:hypothetical protein